MKATQDIYIPEGLQDRINDDERDFLRRVRGRGFNKSEVEAQRNHKYPMDVLENLLGEGKLKTLKILELGSGNGFFLCYALKQGLDIIGIEPGENDGFNGRYLKIVELLEANKVPDPKSRILNVSAEKLPFPDGFFDVVVSVAVLEHVQDLDATMLESLRVLKTGGMLWANVPNYDSVHEGHYNLFWIPSMSKGTAKRYVKLFGRDSSFINNLNFTTPNTFMKYSKCGTLQWHPYSTKLLNPIFVAYNYCHNSKLIPTRPIGKSGITRTAEKLLRSRTCRRILKLPLTVCVELLYVCGQATVFDIILYKGEKE